MRAPGINAIKFIAVSLLLVVCFFSYGMAANVSTSGSCCDLVGDLDNTGTVDVGDLTYLIAYLFTGGASISCEDEADFNLDQAADVGDLTYLIDFLFLHGPSPGLCPLSVHIQDLQTNDDAVQGIASVPDTAAYRVVLWAKTDRWYVQPSIAEPYTYIQSDGQWLNSTYPWIRMVALLVDSTYSPGSIRDYHPSTDPGVVSYDEYPEKSVKYLYWSGYNWRVKNADLVGPGPNYFSDDTTNVWLDPQNRLHLRIDYRNGNWYCGEIVLDHSLGYGRYSFKLDSRVDSLNYNVIFAGFIYETLNQEFDIEFSQILANPFNAQYVVQPWDVAGNIEFFHMPNSPQTSHAFEWRADSIVFTSWDGHADSPTASTLISTWSYTGDNIPVPGNERMRFNLYLFDGSPPTGGTEDEVIVRSFDYTE